MPTGCRPKGHAFSEDNEWQRDFESHFEFDETEDQLRCIDEIKKRYGAGSAHGQAALRRRGLRQDGSRPARRLQMRVRLQAVRVAGAHHDPGLAALPDGDAPDGGLPGPRGVALPLPHAEAAGRNYPQAQAREVDMIVGTHRLVSKDVKFKDLGLVIIDEEQRFGVAQKEKLKSLCSNVDVLTLSATPIPAP